MSYKRRCTIIVLMKSVQSDPNRISAIIYCQQSVILQKGCEIIIKMTHDRNVVGVTIFRTI